MAAKSPTTATEWQLALKGLLRGERVEVGDHPVAVQDRAIIQLSGREHRGRRRAAQQVNQLPSSAQTKEQGRELSGWKVWRSERGELGDLGQKRGCPWSRLTAAVTGEVVNAEVNPVVIAGVG